MTERGFTLTVKPEVSTVLRWGRAKVVELFGADLRSLAALRIVLAVLVLGDIASRIPDLYTHYTDEGILPRTALLDEGMISPWQFSLNLMNGESFFQALLFSATVLAALGLLVGYRTRLMTVVVWVFLISIHMRNNLLNGSGEALLDMLLFWGMFLPLGAYWSVDRARQVPAPRLSTRFLSMATVGLFMQIAFVYWFTALLKSDPEWRVDGTALYYALSIDQIATPIGAFLLQFPALLKVLTFATVGLEAFGPFLLFFPFFTGPVRTAAILAFMSFHFGIWLTMSIGIFPWISALCMVCFLPSWFWDKGADLFVARYAEQPGAAPEHSGTHHQRLSRHAGKLNIFRIFWSDLQARLSALTKAIHSYIKNAATDSSKPRSAAEVADALETNHVTAARSNKSIVLRSSLASNLLAFIFLLYVLFSNITSVSELKMPELLAPLGSSLNIDQGWDMFAPGVLKNDGWYVMPGTLEDRQEVDLMGVTRDDFNLHEVSWEKPQDVRSNFKNEHWRKYLENVRGYEYTGAHQYLARYICREWNARHTGSEQLTNFEIIYMSELTLPDYEYSPPKQSVLWEHSCF
jgi:hypothetical protein